MEQNQHFTIGELVVFQHTDDGHTNRSIERAARRNVEKFERLSLALVIGVVLVIVITIVVGKIIVGNWPNDNTRDAVVAWILGVLGAIAFGMFFASDALSKRARSAERTQNKIVDGQYRELFVASKHFSYAIGTTESADVEYDESKQEAFFRRSDVQEADNILWNEVELTPESIEQHYKAEMSIIKAARRVFGRSRFLDLQDSDAKQRKTQRIAQARAVNTDERAKRAEEIARVNSEIAELDGVDAQLVALD